MTAWFSVLQFALLAGVHAWDYGVPYYPAPYYQSQPQFEYSQCPPTGPESVVCAVAPGSQPSTFPSPCEVTRFKYLTGNGRHLGVRTSLKVSDYFVYSQTGSSFIRTDVRTWNSARTIARNTEVPSAEDWEMCEEPSRVAASCSW